MQKQKYCGIQTKYFFRLANSLSLSKASSRGKEKNQHYSCNWSNSNQLPIWCSVTSLASLKSPTVMVIFAPWRSQMPSPFGVEEMSQDSLPGI
jgi:hypothetical protein